MKTLRPVLALAIITAFLASCSTSNDVVGGIFQKRKHTQGFYHNRNSKLSDEKSSDVALKTKSEANKAQEIRFENTVTPIEKRSVEATPSNVQPVKANQAVSQQVSGDVSSPAQNNSEKAASSSKQSTSAAENTAPAKKKNPSSLREFKKQIKTDNNSKSNSGASDVAIILLVILAIIIPPLAVVLYEGASGRFVIVLILWLLAVFGFILSPLAGLLYLIAMIYALLIVLEVV